MSVRVPMPRSRGRQGFVVEMLEARRMLASAVDAAGTGLLADYFANKTLSGAATVSRTDAVVDFTWPTGTAPAPGMSENNFSVRWQGQVEPRYTQLYTFYTNSDDGVRLWVNNQLLVDQWNDHSNTEHKGTIALEAGDNYAIKMEFYENGWNAIAQLRWSSTSQAKQIIPKSQLYPTVGPALPVVSVTAPDATAAEASLDPGIFRFTRTGDLSQPLSVGYTMGGSAGSGDYALQPTTVTIPALSASTDLTLEPVNDNDSEGTEIATLTLASSASYQISPTDGAASINILDDDAASPPAGGGLQAEYFDNINLTNLKLTRTDAMVDFTWGELAPIPAMGADTFSVRWTGTVTAPTTGVYTFYTKTDDGVRLWVNGVQLINKWQDQGGTEWSGTASLTAGQPASVVMEYFENGWSANARLSWSSATVAKQVIPSEWLSPPAPPVPDTQDPSQPANLALISRTDVTITFGWDACTDDTGVVGYDVYRDGTLAGTATTNQFTDTSRAALTAYEYTVVARDAAGNSSAASSPATFATLAAPPAPAVGTGLLGEYYDNINLTNLMASRTDPGVNFNWGNGSPVASMASDTFSVRWSGVVQPLYTETYTFYTKTDDGGRLWVNGQQIINKWVDQSAPEWSGTISLVGGGFYDIQLEYYENGWSATASLSWSSTRQAKQIIPAARLFPTPTVSVTATDGSASEVGPDSGTFRFARTGDTVTDLVVPIAVGGTASATSDYAALPASVIIPAGQSAVTLDVTPVNDDEGESTENVRVTIQSGTTLRADPSASVADVLIASEDPLPPTAPSTPSITEPLTDGFQVNAADVHMETAAFSDLNPEDTHAASDWEIWTRTATPALVWSAHTTSGGSLVHVHFGDGAFVQSGRTELDFSTNYELRVRHQDSSGLWSAYASRLFSTLPAPQPLPGAPDWTVDQSGYVVETVASNFRLPVDIAFVPNAGTHPLDPYYYVVELYDGIKVVTRNGTVLDYATGLLNFNPVASFPGTGEVGIGGIVVEPASGDLFVSLPYQYAGAPAGSFYNKVVRLHSSDGGLTAATNTTVLDLTGAITSYSHHISNLTIGPDGMLYIHNGEGFDAARALNLDSWGGKVLRANLDGTAPDDNPFYNAADGIGPRDYVFAYGFRNAWGGAWRAADGQHYSAENGAGANDRFARVVAGGNYGWDGTAASMFTNSLYNWTVTAIAPLRLGFIQQSTFGGSGFPAAKQDHAFVTLTGATYATGPSNNKAIVEFAFDANGNVTGPPVRLIHYTGNGKATAAALAAGPDGLYFSDLYVDDTLNGFYQPAARGSHILRVRYVGT